MSFIYSLTADFTRLNAKTANAAAPTAQTFSKPASFHRQSAEAWIAVKARDTVYERVMNVPSKGH